MRIGVALSLILAVGVGVFWVRSYGSGDLLRLHRADVEGGRVRGTFASFGSTGGLACVTLGYSTHPPDRWNSLVRFRGDLFAAAGQGWHLRIKNEPPDGRAVVAQNADEAREFAGIGRYRQRTPPGDPFPYELTHWLIPHPYLMVLFSFPPSLWLILAARRGMRRRGRRRRGECLDCGYDLRATPGRCPECGREHSPQGG